MKLALVVAMVAGMIPPQTLHIRPKYCTRYGEATITNEARPPLSCMDDDYDPNGVWQQIQYPGAWYWIPVPCLPIPKELQ